MDTIVAKITNDSLTDKKIYEQAGKILREGGLVAFPTETVYGLGADALDEEASAKIYAAKGRPSDNPLIVHIADIEALYKLSCEVPDKALKLADKFWPGPLTMILKKSDIVPDSITGGLGTVAISGEKALTAIALLFAIQNLKPSPFCLLDEIEAALDDSNVGRYANYLHKLTKHTQFIVITHRRGTMAAADRLYGITMQEKGVSTLVSVDLIANDLNEPNERKS